MPRVDVDAALDELFLRSSIIYGVSRAGKTILNASMPRPAIFASEREGGYKSVQTMDRSLWYEPDMKPIIYTISSIKEMLPYFKEVEEHTKKGRIKTIVVELSFYSEDIIRSMTSAEEKNGWAKYKLLDDHIQWLDATAKRLGVRIAYNALAADPGDLTTKAPAGIYVAGKALARKLPAATDLTGYLRTEDIGARIDRILHLTPYGAYPAGHRYGAKLPPFVRNATYRKLEDLIMGRATVDEYGNVVYGEGAGANGSAAAELPPLA